MWRNAFKVSLRNLFRNRIYSMINIAGLAIGMACCVMILLFVYTELSFDRQYAQADRIFRVAEVFRENGTIVEESASIPFPVGPTISQAFPGVKSTRFYKTFEKVPLLSYGEKRFYEDNLLFADSTVFDIFSFPMLQGDRHKALAEPFSIVLTESMAKKYFGNQDPVGKVLRFENQLDYKVTGVMADLPVNTHLKFDFLASLMNMQELFQASGTAFTWRGWYWNPCHTFITLPSEYTQADFEAMLPEMVRTHAPENMRESLSFYLQPLPDIHLKSHIYQEMSLPGNEQAVYLFMAIAVFVLLIACINFMNLATARSVTRAREIAVRKVSGAHRGQLIRQFLGESLLISLLSAVAGFFLVQFLTPVFSSISGTELDPELVGYPVLLLCMGGLALVTGLIAGSYPAFFLSSYKPVEGLNLQGGVRPGSLSVIFRKGLVVFQFCISIALLAGTAIIYQQHRYLLDKELGFDKEQLVMIPIRGTSIKQREDAFKDRLRQDPEVINASALSNIIGRDVQIVPFQVEGKTEPQQVSGLFVDFDFISTFKIEMEEGRGFDPAFPTDSSSYLVNESARQLFEWEHALDMSITSGRKGQVIGKVRDFNFCSLQERIRPLVITFRPWWFSYVAVRLSGRDTPAALEHMETAWREFEPERPFEPFFLDDNLNQLYEREGRLSKIFSAFALLAIFIGCLGLFGLAAFAAEQRTREIGIRRVLGASVSGIIGMLSKDFLKLVLVAILIASPAAWYFLDRWLQNFPYRVEIDWLVFALAGLAAMLVAGLTVSFQSLRAAVANPVDSLRSE